MPHWLELPYLALTTHLDSRFYLSQALHYPGLVRLASKPPLPPLIESLQRHLAEAPALALHRHYPPGLWETRVHTLLIQPAKSSPAWREAWTIELSALHYQPAPGLESAFFPALAIEVTVNDPADIKKTVLQQVRGELMRRGALKHLDQLVMLSRWGPLTCQSGQLNLQRKSIQELTTGEEPAEDWLPKVATALLALPPSAAHYEHHLERLAELLGAEGRRSVLLVGPSGVGKTAIFHELARRKRSYELGATPFFETSGSRLISSELGCGGWQERCQQLVRQWAKRQAVIHLGSLVELLEVGRHSTHPTGLAGFLRPTLARGQVQAVAECTDSQLTYLERELPQLLEAFVIYRVEKPDRETTAAILAARFQGLPEAARQQALELHERFASHSASPGWEVRLLQAVQRKDGASVIETFSHQSGIPSRFLDPEQPLPQLEVSRWFNARVQGQIDAVDRVVERLLTFKAALNRPARPLASLLLMGPTGTGKTELARSLAEYLFQDRQRLTRLDMSEYSDPWAVRRLVGWAGGRPGLLVQMVRELPFQVVLFDELEKAHPDFFDLLLQVLGEGRLTDASGNLADFSNCLIVMTTNLGSEAMQKGSVGFRDQPPQQGYLEAVRAAFRPELLNRIDEIVPFARLSQDTVELLAEIELEQIQKSPGLRRRNLRWHITAQVVPALAEKGYDARYGARPLKRAIERLLLAPLSVQLNSHPEDAPLQVLVGAIEGVVQVFVRPLHDPQTAIQEAQRKRSLGDQITLLRRRSLRFMRGPLVSELCNDRVRHMRLQPKRPWPEENNLDAIENLHERIQELEELALLGLEQIRHFDEEQLRRGCSDLLAELNASLLRLYSRSFADRGAITMAFYSDHHASLRQLADAYMRLGRSSCLNTEIQSIQAQKGEVPAPTLEHPQPNLDRRTQGLDWWLQGFPGAHLGVLIRFSGLNAYPTFHLESGVHVFLRPEGEKKVLVEVSPAPLTSGDPDKPFMAPAYLPPEDLHRKGTLTQLYKGSVCRTYDLPHGKCIDSLLKKPRNCLNGNELDLTSVVDARLLRVAEEDGLAPVGSTS